MDGSSIPLTDRQTIDMLWVIVASGMVFFMQLGFLCLEIGLVQAKNAIDTAVKNVADFVITSLVFLVIGFGLMFGHSFHGLFGASDFLLSTPSPDATFLGAAFIFMQLAFAGCAVTIIAGGTAERSDLVTHLLISVVIAGLIYPLFGHWVWGNLYYADGNGWLAKMGFIDFAGSSVVHGVGGWVALAGIMAVGPRRGRYDAAGRIQPMGGNNIPMAALGTFILWFGWFGFNGGSVLHVSGDVGLVILKTNFAAAAGGLTSYVYARWRRQQSGLQALPMLSGALGGMVAITAGSFSVPLWASLVIGGLAGVLVNASQELLDHFRLDDPSGAVPVHGFCGALGTILTGVFATQETIAAHAGTRIDQIAVQVLGTLVCFVWAFGIGRITFWLINKVHPIRVSVEEEQRGLNVSEYDDVLSWLDHRKTQQYETAVDTLNTLVDQRTQALRSEHERLDTVLNSMADGLIVTNPQGVITLTNPAFTRLMHTPASVGQSLERVLSQSDLSAVIDQALQRVGHVFSTRFVLDAHHYQASARGIEQADSPRGVAGVVTVIRDITPEVQAEQSRLDFVSNVSHELRTPLTSVIGFAKVIRQLFRDDLRPHASTLGPAQHETLDLIDEDLDILAEESERLTRLINDVLDLSRMDAGSLKWEPTLVNPLDIINQTVALFMAVTAERGQRLIVDAPDAVPLIHVDSDRFQQVITNLVSNAIKFTPGGAITIHVEPLAIGQSIHLGAHHFCPDSARAEWPLFVTGTAQPWLLLSIIDNGVGIDPNELAVIFERFGQAGQLMTNKPGGTGLGLAICLTIVQRLNGFLWVESELGHGSRFVIAVPCVSTAVSALQELGPVHQGQLTET